MKDVSCNLSKASVANSGIAGEAVETVFILCTDCEDYHGRFGVSLWLVGFRDYKFSISAVVWTMTAPSIPWVTNGSLTRAS